MEKEEVYIMAEDNNDGTLQANPAAKAAPVIDNTADDSDLSALDFVMANREDKVDEMDVKGGNGLYAEIAGKISEAKNVLIALSSNPSVDEMAAAIGLSLYLSKLSKRATAIYSGETPNALEFLKPEETFESSADTLQDFVIALNKDKADHLRYKLDGDFVKIYITPYKTKIAEGDLEFSYGDYNVDLVLALNVANGVDLDSALREHGRIMHDAVIINITTGESGKFGEIVWSEQTASSVSEMIAKLIYSANSEVKIDKEEATAFLTGIVAATNRFSNDKTTPQTMQIASKLMTSGANQQLVSKNITPDALNEAGQVVSEVGEMKPVLEKDPTELNIEHKKGEEAGGDEVEFETKPVVESEVEPEVEPEVKPEAEAEEKPEVGPVERPVVEAESEVKPPVSVPEGELKEELEKKLDEMKVESGPQEENKSETSEPQEVNEAKSEVETKVEAEEKTDEVENKEENKAETPQVASLPTSQPVPPSILASVPRPAPVMPEVVQPEPETDANVPSAVLPEVKTEANAEINTDAKNNVNAENGVSVDTNTNEGGGFAEEYPKEKILQPPEGAEAGKLDDGNKYGHMLEEALEGAGRVGSVQSNPAMASAPAVPNNPEINGVPEINYTPVPNETNETVLPPPPAPTIDMNMPMPGIPNVAPDTPTPVVEPIQPAVPASVENQQSNDMGTFKIPGM